MSVKLVRGGAIQRQAKVAVGQHVLFEPVAPMMIGLGNGVSLDDDMPLAVDGIGEAGTADVEPVRPSPVGRLAVEELSEERERAGSQRGAPAAKPSFASPEMIAGISALPYLGTTEHKTLPTCSLRNAQVLLGANLGYQSDARIVRSLPN